MVDEDGSHPGGRGFPLGKAFFVRWLYDGLSSADDEAISEKAFFSLGGMTPLWLGVAGAGICVVGVVGDLWESLLKRLAMVKVSVMGEGSTCVSPEV